MTEERLREIEIVCGNARGGAFVAELIAEVRRLRMMLTNQCDIDSAHKLKVEGLEKENEKLRAELKATQEDWHADVKLGREARALLREARAELWAPTEGHTNCVTDPCNLHLRIDAALDGKDEG